MSRTRGGYCKKEDIPSWPIGFSATVVYKMLGAEKFMEFCKNYDEQILKNKLGRKEKSSPTNEDLIDEISGLF
jgi:hypothetical protein